MLQKKIKKKHGQATVEFALIVPILILIFALIIDLGQVISNKVALTSATADTARWASINYGNYDSDGTLNLTAMSLIAQETLERSMGPGVRPKIDDLKLEGDDKFITIKAEAKVPFLTGLSGSFTGGKNYIIVKSTASRPLEPKAELEEETEDKTEDETE